MKRITTSIIALLALTIVASAQQYGAIATYSPTDAKKSLVPSTATSMAFNSTTAATGLFNVSDYNGFAVSISCQWSNPAACWNGEGDDLEALQAVFWPATSASQVHSNIVYTCIFKCNTNYVYPLTSYGTNFTDFQYGYLKLAYLSNALTVAHATNVVLRVYAKPNRKDFR